MIGNAEEIKPLILSCLDENPKMRPVTAKVLEKVKKELKCHCQDQEEEDNQQEQQHSKQRQQQLMAAQLRSDFVTSSEPVNQKQSEESFHDGSIASYTSEMVVVQEAMSQIIHLPRLVLCYKDINCATHKLTI